MKKKFMLRAFSLMEMMIVLLIVAIIAAASAPMISKKMMHQTGTGDSPWVFTGTGNSVAFNMRGNRNDTVLIGTNSEGIGAQNAPLYIRTPEDAAGIPDGNAISFAMGNEVVGHLGITKNNTYMSNIIPQELGGSNDGAVIIGHLNTNRQAEREAGSDNANDTIGNKTVIGYFNKLWLNDSQNTSQDTIIGSSIGLSIAADNPSTVIGTNINHQYSKSYEYELDFRNYAYDYLNPHISYFSLLRCWNEYQIVQEFLRHKEYLSLFRSCNRGTRDNKWCNHCSKCLYVYIMLYPYLSEEEMNLIFDHNLLDDKSLEEEFLDLVVASRLKPFECVGTYEEVCFAISKAIFNIENGLIDNNAEEYDVIKEELPYLLKYYKENFELIGLKYDLTKLYNPENNLTEEQNKILKEEIFND